jgi:hypothetical protein
MATKAGKAMIPGSDIDGKNTLVLILTQHLRRTFACLQALTLDLLTDVPKHTLRNAQHARAAAYALLAGMILLATQGLAGSALSISLAGGAVGPEKFAAAEIRRAAALTAAWADASKTFPLITRFFWGDIDIKWFPEACRRKGGFYTVRNFIEGGTMPGAGVLNIMEWRSGLLAKQKLSGVTPLEIAATRALQAVPKLRRAAVTPAASASEYGATLGDIEAMSHLGLYYAAKIRGACALALFDRTSDAEQQTAAVRHLEEALAHWQNYAGTYTRQYVQPVLYNRAGVVDIPRQTGEVAADVQMARDWKPGTINETSIKRSGTEAGFKR